MRGEESFKFNGQAYPGFKAHETKAVAVQPVKSPEKVDLLPVVESVGVGLLAGFIVGKVVGRYALRGISGFRPEIMRR